jgi:hypothetical protein
MVGSTPTRFRHNSFLPSYLRSHVAISGALVFTHPQAGRVQVPITSGIVSKDAATFSGQNQFSLGGSIEITFHGTVSGASLRRTTDMTSRGLFGTVANSGPLTLGKQ